MTPEQLKKVLNLVKKTGDKVIVTDGNSSEDLFVVMSFDGYSNLIGLDSKKTEEKAIEKVEPIVVNQSIPEPEKPLVNIELSSDSKETENLTDEDLTDKINREISMWKNRDDSVYLGEDNKPKKVWQIPSKVKDKAQEVE